MNKSLYPSLIKIGLEDYLKQRGDGNMYKEIHMLKMDSFVGNLSDDQKKILKDKIDKKKNETHTQHNDVFHELSIAYVFYGSDVNFLQETDTKTSDFYSNDLFVEVKTINNSEEERKRQDKLNKGPYCEISPMFNQNKIEDIKREYIECVGKKFNDHVEKAKEQLSSTGGHIWIVYAIDSPPKFHEKINKEVEGKFDEIIKENQSKILCIRYINFEDLRNKIASRQ